MNPREESLKELLLNKTITDIEFYSFEDSYFSPDNDKTWLVRAGIELKMGEEIFSFGWHPDSEFHDGSTLPVSEYMNEELQVSPLEAKNAVSVKNLIGKTIEAVRFEWNSYQEYDENFELKEELSYMPVEIRMDLSEGNKLQIAAAALQLNEGKIDKAIYDSEANVLIAINHNYDLIHR